jgi:hypothetical protein
MADDDANQRFLERSAASSASVGAAKIESGSSLPVLGTRRLPPRARRRRRHGFNELPNGEDGRACLPARASALFQ